MGSPYSGAPIICLFHRRVRLDRSPRPACEVGTPGFSTTRWRNSLLAAVPGASQPLLLEEEQVNTSFLWAGEAEGSQGTWDQHGDQIFGTQFWTNDFLNMSVFFGSHRRGTDIP